MMGTSSRKGSLSSDARAGSAGRNQGLWFFTASIWVLATTKHGGTQNPQQPKKGEGMALATLALPYGLRDVKVRPIDANGVVGSSVDLPASRTFSFSESEDYEELRGDDRLIAIRGKGPSVDWSLEAGGISLDAFVVMSGGILTTSGTTPNITKFLVKKVTDARPYFQCEGQAISDAGGDWHVKLYKCRASENLEGELGDGQFWLTSASGKALGDASDNLYEFRNNETAVAVP
jgi:hypothetical protein